MAKGNSANSDWMQAAKKVFSEAMVAELAAKGQDFLESRSEGVWLYDEKGNASIDAYTAAGTHNLGRTRSELSQALLEAAQKTDQGNFILLSEEKVRLARRLASFLPHDLSCMLFTVVRGEAMDAACKLARGHTERPHLVTVDGGWYGQTGFAMSLSEREDKSKYGSLIPGVTTVPFGDVVEMKKAVSKRTAAVILEPVQAENGCRAASKEYLRQLRQICDRNGTLLILDETQTGFGRTGERFACEGLGVYPDILILGEALAGGMFPMCGLAFPPRVKAFFDKHPLIHLCTFGGHDVGCLVAEKSLELYEILKPWENAKRQGRHILGELQALAVEHSKIVRSVSGVGLLISIQMDSVERALGFCNAARKAGLLCMPGEVMKASVVLRPSLTISDDDSETLLKAVRDSLQTL
ncbi:MAG: aspartate aminotransferase family protein [Desulfatibacillaceae bacterium]|nr:aspartate aminotransferase family protein [Desulfatibacillaceae bacterium]